MVIEIVNVCVTVRMDGVVDIEVDQILGIQKYVVGHGLYVG